MRITLPLARVLFDIAYRLARRWDGSSAPPIKRRAERLAAGQARAYDELLQSTLAMERNALVDYRLPWPKVSFLNYLCDHCGYAAHGSTRQDLDLLHPLRLSSDASEFGGSRLVFGTPDAVWAVWFAILDKSGGIATRNDCTRLGPRDGSWIKYYHFDLPRRLAATPTFCNGMVYLAAATEFSARHRVRRLEPFGAEFEEWGSPVPVEPILRVPVTPGDFPYLDRVEYIL